MKDKKVHSLKLGLVLIALFCWVIPVSINIVYVATDAKRNADKQFSDVVDRTADDIVYRVSSNVSSVVNKARLATNEGSVLKAYNILSSTYKNKNISVVPVQINNFLDTHYRYDENVIAASVFFPDYVDYQFDTLNPQFKQPDDKLSAYRRLVKPSADYSSNPSNITFVSKDDELYLIHYVNNSKNKTIAILTMWLNVDKLFGGIESSPWCSGAAIYMNDMSYQAFLKAPCESLPSPDRNQLRINVPVKINNKDLVFLQIRKSVNGVDLMYSLAFNRREFVDSFNDYGIVMYIILLSFIPIFLFGVLYFVRNIFIPIKQLTKVSREIEDGNLGEQIDSRIPNREFSYLTDTFNHMSLRLKNQFDRIYSEELALRDAKIMALQMQINPHFLNNTLEIINWEARLGNNAKVSRMIEALSIILDAAMSRDNSPLVSLSKELMYLESYLFIIGERFGKRITIEKNIDRSLLQLKIPRLIMQPITENAIEHGVSVRQHGKINLSVFRRDHKMFLSVENDSPLLVEDRARIERLLSPDFVPDGEGFGHLGIHNVNMRLKMIYGDAGGLEIIGGNDRTLSIITIPLE